MHIVNCSHVAQVLYPVWGCLYIIMIIQKSFSIISVVFLIWIHIAWCWIGSPTTIPNTIRRHSTPTEMDIEAPEKTKPKWASGGIVSDTVNALIGFKPLFGVMKGSNKVIFCAFRVQMVSWYIIIITNIIPSWQSSMNCKVWQEIRW